MKKSLQIILIGAGNLGFHLGKKLFEEGLVVQQVFSRKKINAKRLAKLIDAEPISNLDKISKEGDLYILAIPDNIIETVANSLSKKIPASKLIVHTSGATPSSVLQPFFKNYGIFYPLQTFSISKEVDYQNIPICVDSNLKKNRILLEKIGKQISKKVYLINDKERAILHVAAVFVNNFSNNLFTIGETITKKENLPFEILKPLIQETVNKILDHSPNDMQTGPAKRGDKNTIDRHLKYLDKNFPEFSEIYKLMTHSINSKIVTK